jgi:hypothetical protein
MTDQTTSAPPAQAVISRQRAAGVVNHGPGSPPVMVGTGRFALWAQLGLLPMPTTTLAAKISKEHDQ